jgi:uncharacterized SAM-binding protein YcdF (DUF218 family)
MFFVVSKVISFLFTPLIWIITLLALGIFLKNKKKAKIFLITGFALLYLMGNPFIFNEVCQHWEVPAVNEDQFLKQKIGGVIILGGLSFWDNGLKRIQFSKSSDRFMQGLLLHKKGIGKKIIISGGSGSLTYPDDRESVFLKDYLVKIGVNTNEILIEKESKNTRENAVFTKELLDSCQLKGPFLLVTSGYHMRRSIACFEKAGIEVIPFSTDRYSGETKYHLDYLLIPNAGILLAWDTLFHEWIGYITYKIAGYI